MAIKSEHIQSTAEHDSSPDRKPVETPKVSDEPSFDLASEAILKATPPDPNAQALALRRVRGETRERLMTQFQQSFGNRYIQRVMDRVHAADQLDGDLAQRIQAASSEGDTLDAAMRSRLAASLGADVSNVRVHTDQEADRLSREVSAIAFTTGPHIFFREGTYQPETPGGLRLIAHEAAHTLQQASGPVDGTLTDQGVSISDPADGFEQAAEHAADGVVSGTAPSAPLAAGGTQVQRQVPEEEEEKKLQMYRAAAPMAAQRTATETIQTKRAPEISLQRWYDANGEWHPDVSGTGGSEGSSGEDPSYVPPAPKTDQGSTSEARSEPNADNGSGGAGNGPYPGAIQSEELAGSDLPVVGATTLVSPVASAEAAAPAAAAAEPGLITAATVRPMPGSPAYEAIAEQLDKEAATNFINAYGGPDAFMNAYYGGPDAFMAGAQGTQAATMGTEAATMGTEAATMGTEAATMGTEAATIGTGEAAGAGLGLGAVALPAALLYMSLLNYPGTDQSRYQGGEEGARGGPVTDMSSLAGAGGAGGEPYVPPVMDVTGAGGAGGQKYDEMNQGTY